MKTCSYSWTSFQLFICPKDSSESSPLSTACSILAVGYFFFFFSVHNGDLAKCESPPHCRHFFPAAMHRFPPGSGHLSIQHLLHFALPLPFGGSSLESCLLRDSFSCCNLFTVSPSPPGMLEAFFLDCSWLVPRAISSSQVTFS